jgi:hypothetical protein
MSDRPKAVPLETPSQDVDAAERARLWAKEPSAYEYSDHDRRAAGERPRFTSLGSRGMRKLALG